MRIRLILLVLAAAMVAYGLWLTSHRGTARSRPSQTNDVKPAGAKPAVPIKDGKTLDFSTGKPVYQDDAANKAAIAKGVAEMDAAAGNVTFGPTSVPRNTAPAAPPSK